jgi:hypothetical protein
MKKIPKRKPYLSLIINFGFPFKDNGPLEESNATIA